MDNDFVRVQRHPTPEELLQALLQIAPQFALHWDRPDNYFRSEDGSFSVHGVFAELLFEFIEKCVLTIQIHRVESRTQHARVFSKNMAGEGDLSRAITPYLGTQSKEYFDKWN
jgi:hypothetical protein